MKKGIVLSILAIITLVIYANCEKNKSKVYPVEGTAPPIHINDPATSVRWNSVGILDDSIAKKIAVEQTNSRRTPTNTLEVWAQLRNRTDYPLQVEARVQFFDADKAPIEGPTSWKRIYLPANSIATYSMFSTRIDVSYYYIEVREGK